jgi:hypothetical protein
MAEARRQFTAGQKIAILRRHLLGAQLGIGDPRITV